MSAVITWYAQAPMSTFEQLLSTLKFYNFKLDIGVIFITSCLTTVQQVSEKQHTECTFFSNMVTLELETGEWRHHVQSDASSTGTHLQQETTWVIEVVKATLNLSKFVVIKMFLVSNFC